MLFIFLVPCKPSFDQRTQSPNREDYQKSRHGQEDEQRDDDDPGIDPPQTASIHGHVYPDQCLDQCRFGFLVRHQAFTLEVFESRPVGAAVVLFQSEIRNGLLSRVGVRVLLIAPST